MLGYLLFNVSSLSFVLLLVAFGASSWLATRRRKKAYREFMKKWRGVDVV